MDKEAIALFGVITILASVATYAVFNQHGLAENDYRLVNAKLDTWYCIDFKKAGSDTWQEMGCNHNVFIDMGKNHIQGLLNGTVTTSEAVKYLALGNGTTPTAASTTLNSEVTGCGLGRVLGDAYYLGTGWWEVNTTFTYSCATNLKVNTTGSFNAASNGVFLAGGNLPSEITLTTNGDQIRLRHNNTIS